MLTQEAARPAGLPRPYDDATGPALLNEPNILVTYGSTNLAPSSVSIWRLPLTFFSPVDYVVFAVCHCGNILSDQYGGCTGPIWTATESRTRQKKKMGPGGT